MEESTSDRSGREEGSLMAITDNIVGVIEDEEKVISLHYASAFVGKMGGYYIFLLDYGYNMTGWLEGLLELIVKRQ